MDLHLFQFSGFGYPTTSGVYGFFKMTEDFKSGELLYIGSAINLDRRLIGHELRRKFNGKIFYSVGFIETEQYKELEVELIKKLNPVLNKQYRTNL